VGSSASEDTTKSTGVVVLGRVEGDLARLDLGDILLDLCGR
jgi:hypothetical protein